MINNGKVIPDKREPLQLIGSQINISSRSNYINKKRPSSAALPRKRQITNKTRPKSAESKNIDLSLFKPYCQWDGDVSDYTIDEKSCISPSQYTDYSSKVLQALLGQETFYDGRTTCEQKSIHDSFKPQPEDVYLGKFCSVETVSDILPAKSFDTNQVTNVTLSIENSYTVGEKHINKTDIERLEIQTWVPEEMEEKTVKFVDSDSRPEIGSNDFLSESYSYRGRSEQSLNCCCQNESELRELLSSCHVSGNYCHSVSPRMKVTTESVSDRKNKEEEGSGVSVLFGNSQVKLDTNERLAVHQLPSDQCQVIESPRSEEKCKTQTNSVTIEELISDSPKSNFGNLVRESESFGKFESNSEKLNEIPQKLSPVLESKPILGCSSTEDDTSDSTYEEIVQILKTLEEEEEDGETLNVDDMKEPIPLKIELFDRKNDNLKHVYSYLEKIENEDDDGTNQEGVVDKDLTTADIVTSPRLDELLNKNSVELAHEVLSLKLQIEDQKKGIKLLRDTLAEMKEASKSAEASHQEALKKANADAEALVQRHQKFIKQLLNQKKNLNETVSKLVEDLKSGEERHKRNIKAMEEKHSIEIKRVREAQAAADKVKREKWMEMKTQKIKEMTVKGLEPELSRMAAHQQQEVTELRNLHRAELEAVELRAARRTSELMDQLRADLTKEKENAIKRETENLRIKMEKDFEEERNSMENLCHQVKEDLRREKEKLFREQREFQQKLLDYKKEAEKEKQRTIQEYQEKLEESRRKHLKELENLKESFEAEKEIWMNNYRKQEDARFLERERELHQEYKRERDRDIEMIIDTLEKESTQALTEAREAADNKLRRFKEKFESEIKELEASENSLKNKLSEVKCQVLEKEDVITKLNSQIRQFQTEVTCLRKSCEDMTAERATLKEIIRKEFAVSIGEEAKEKENLKKEILNLKDRHLKELAKKDQINIEIKNEMQKELARVYSRIKAAVTKKEKIIESLREENKSIQNKCNQLEFMLDQQRRNLLL